MDFIKFRYIFAYPLSFSSEGFMKLKIYIALLLLLVLSSLHAQVGIGTTTPSSSSMLDISSANSGILIPRVALTGTADTTTITSPAVSLLVYNSGFAPNGFYYWNGSVWVQLTQSNNAWALTGNSGTTAATNFIGTIDDVDIVLKRFNTRAGFLGNPNTTSGNMNISFGANSLLNPSGTRNVAIGTNVLPSNGTGNRNTAVGERAMFTNTTGSFNTAVGTGALYSNLSGDFNTAIGRQSLTSSSLGLYNTALGNDSGYSSTNGSNNIFIGYRSGYNETGSNKLYIEYAALTTDSSPNNALIYGDFGVTPKILRTNAQFQIGNPTVSGYALPTVRGTAGQFLQTDGAGATSWAATTGVFPYATTGAATGIYNVALTQYTLRVFGSVSEVRLPTPVGNTGKVFVIIGSNGIPAKIFSTAAGTIYDDVTSSTVTTISGSVRYTVQSDGTDWIVIAR